MRKTILPRSDEHSTEQDVDWLALETLARVEVTSEAEGFSIEGALCSDQASGWRAGEPGRQIIRLRFDDPQRVGCIRLLFREEEQQRTQEFTVAWSPGDGAPFREIIRQQYNFSPPSTVRELEEYRVELLSVGAIEIVITPDINGGPARASLAQLRIG